ncbi:MAG: hypothetical protein WKF96_07505 [Solirubrobacteraceae bacterium]
MVEANPQTAFYYPGVIWRSGDWIKSLVLFFDRVALLVPDYMKDRPLQLDPAIVAGLEEAGLLVILSPETLIDKEATERLSTEMTRIIVAGALDNLPSYGQFAELSWSRLGGVGDPGLAQMIFEELQERGLAHESQDGFSIPLHPMVRSLILVLLAQIVKEAGPRVGLELCPATDAPQIQRALGELISSVAPAGPADVVEVDLEFVAPDLSAVPMDELLDFRKRHAADYQAYARSLRQVVRELRGTEPAERAAILTDRRRALDEAARALKRGPLRDLATGGVMAVGLLAGVAGVLEGSEISGALGALAALGAGATATSRSPPDAFSYLFAARGALP